ncbi:uncharacterized protein C15orf39 homolog isoform X1 [Astyanax mexicanus]|uniref:uncharacterized protein C15orf39 homolog isoform X1 n=1 Tax=Astyanax mexicanus TaxID=7994 RepID=UPI0020CAE806|nr:uncharacterized protein C15orf39 homolog isoform X1 [Astyanax mexicanus]
MNNKRVQNFMDPLAQSKITRLEGTVGTMVPPGLPKADSLPQYSQDKSLPYRRTYISCNLSGQEALDLPSAWSPSRTYVRNGESPGVHSVATEGSVTHQAFYRPDNVAFPVESGSPASVEALAAKHKLSYYNRSKQSPSTAGVVSPVAFRKLPVGCTSVSPSSGESPVGLAVPKPVYGHSPCFTDLKRTVGQNYAVERGLQRVPPQMFEDDWAAHYGHWAYLHKMEQEALMQQRMSFPFEHCGERLPLKDVTPQGYHSLSPSRSRRSAFAEPNHSGYVYSPAHPVLPPSAEQCQRFQVRPQMHKDLASFYKTPTRMHYGPSPTQVYQDRPHISKYGEIPQNSLLYCPQTSTEQSIYRPENLSHIAESHIVEKPQQTSGQCSIPQSYYSDLPHPYTMIPTSHPAVRNLHPYPGFRMHLNTNQMNMFTERLCPPPVMHQVDRPLDFSIRRDKNAESHRDPNGHIGISGTYHQAQVSNHIGAQNDTLGASNQRHDGFPVGSSHNYTSSPQCTAVVSNKNPGSSPANSVAIPKRHSKEGDNDCESLRKVQKMDQHESDGSESPSSPPMPVINKVFSLAPYKAYLEVTGMFSPANDSSSSKIHSDSEPQKEEAMSQRTNPKPSLCQDDLNLKAVKTSPASNLNSDGLQMVKVKKEKLETNEAACKSEMRVSHSHSTITQCCNNGIVKEEPADFEPADLKPADSEPADIKLAHLEPADLKPAADIKVAADLNPADLKPAADLKLAADLNPASLKLEADLNPADLKPEADIKPDTDLKLAADVNSAVCDAEHRIVVVKSDFEPECHPVTPEIPEPSIERKHEPVAVNKLENVQTKNTPIKPCELPATLPPKPPAPPQTHHTLQPTFALSKIPPHCLKISRYNIIIPEVLKSSVPSNPVLPPSPVETSPAKSSSRHARHQFMELHQSLCTLISTCISQTSRWELKEWLSRLNLVSPPVKTQKVSCLLGSKARDVWLKEEGIVAALSKVVVQLQAYVIRLECPFLHVIRAGAVFIPMLVVKEVLFPQIQGTFIDQVLQEHRVELRPTTLSEERHLTQLHKRAFSSKLRRLLSLKHLQDIYPDLVNLLYYSKACSVLDSTSTDVQTVPQE